MHKYFKFITLVIALSLIGLSVFFYYYTLDKFREAMAGSTQSLVFYNSTGKPFYTVSRDFNKTYIPIAKMKRELLMSAVAIEDTRFFQHIGFDLPRLTKLFFYAITFQKLSFGASTITQQLVKNVLLTPEISIKRKFIEILSAIVLEIRYSKAEILEFYLNNIFFGKNSYGVETSAQNYFGKKAIELNLAESALLAALIKKPEGYSPLNNLDIARKRQVLVLKRLLQIGWITQAEYMQAVKQKVVVFSDTKHQRLAPYFVAGILNELTAKYGDDALYKKGLRIYTTLNWHAQNTMERVIKEAMKNFDADQQVAAISIDNKTGRVIALVGGNSFVESQFNRAIQAMRPPGSAIKAFLYSLALEKGYLPTQTFMDEPSYYIKNDLGSESYDNYYAPKNFDLTNKGEITLAYAFITSNNVISVSLLNELGLDDYAEFGNRLDLNIDRKQGLCLALGCNSVSLKNITSAYSIFPNRGKVCEPIFYEKITTASGEIIEDLSDEEYNCQQLMDKDTAYVMKHLLNEVIKKGTAKNARINRFAGGKTGTSDNFRDAWFIGFTEAYTTGFWMGHDDYTPMDRETGGRTPAKMWSDYMLAMPESIEDGIEKEQEDYANEWETVKICGTSGYLATSFSPFLIEVKLRADNVPTQLCEVSTEDYQN